MSAGGVPCRGELEFWTVMRAQMMEQTRQLRRIADALEARNAAEAAARSPVSAPRKIGPRDIVIWTDPETGTSTGGWEVASIPEQVDGCFDPLGVYTLVNQDGSVCEAHLHELTLDTSGRSGL